MGLLDWLTDGSLGTSTMGDASGDAGMVPPTPSMPPVQQTGADVSPISPPQPNPGAMAPPINPATQAMPGGQGAGPPTPDPTPAAGPPDPPIDPSTQAIGGGTGAGPAAPPVPLPQPRPPGADAAPPMPPAIPAAPAATPGAPMSLAPTAPGPSAAPTKPWQLGDQTALGRALGIDPKSQSFNTALTGFGSGLTAAGNSKGKSPFQALTSGAGASIEGASKEEHAANKDAQGYLNAAINAKKAGDDAAYKTNYTSYLAAKLKAEQDKAASDKATANKNDSPTQLYLSAQRLVQPDRNAMNKQIQQMQKDGAPPDQIAKAQADGEAAINAKLNNHYATLGIHPQTAAQIAQQPGNSQTNPINGRTAGITPDNITKKLQPGQYYTNPTNGKLFIYKGESEKSSTSKPSTPSSKPEPAEPMKKEKATTAADEDDD